MTEFRTPVAPLSYQGLISHAAKLLMLGSCFAANVGERLRRDLFDVEVNPLGTLYNPASIAEACRRLADAEPFTDSDIFEHGGRLHCWHCHSSLSSSSLDRAGYLSQLNSLVNKISGEIKDADIAVLTFGTRHVYTLNESGGIVANCHKMPAYRFTEKDMGVEQCSRYMAHSIESLRKVNPEMRIILTVSPVRYVGEGLHRSTLSKSVLLLACEMVQKQFEDVIYFPSYEIMMDDLRDYRFYASDMKHPSDVAVDYIYSLFADSFFDARTVEIAGKCRKLTARLAHRSLSGEPDLAFESKTGEIATRLAQDYPELTTVLNKILTL